MKQVRTRFNLESLDDRIVPEGTNPLVPPVTETTPVILINNVIAYTEAYFANTANTVNYQNLTGGPAGAGPNIVAAIPNETVVDPRRLAPTPPVLPTLPRNGTESARNLGVNEQNQVNELQRAIEGMEQRNVELEAELASLKTQHDAKYALVAAQKTKIASLERARAALIAVLYDPGASVETKARASGAIAGLNTIIQAENTILSGLVSELNVLADSINDRQKQIYQNLRKIIEMQNAIDLIRRNADKGYPEVSLIVPDHVFDQTLIGDDHSGVVNISTV